MKLIPMEKNENGYKRKVVKLKLGKNERIPELIRTWIATEETKRSVMKDLYKKHLFGEGIR